MEPNRIAYFTNQYPKVSHSFIRREILAMEKQGFHIQRIALRGWDAQLVDPEDIQEQTQTRYILQNLLILPIGLLNMLLLRPFRFIRAFSLAIRMSRKAERPLPYHLIYLAEACVLTRWLEAFGATHVHAHFGTNPAEVVMLSRVLGGPEFSFTVHGPEEFDKPLFLGLPEKIKRAAFVVAISSYGKSQLHRWTDHANWTRIKVVHCGLEKSFHDIPAPPPPSRTRMVCIGRLCEQKGQLLLVEAANLLNQQNIEFELVLAGDGEMRPDIEHLISQYKLQDKIHITGWISSSQVRDEILKSRCMVLPSFAEGLPVVIMEAMALYRPVISTYVAGIPELIIPNENGMLVPAGSVYELADAMKHMLGKSTEEISAMGTAAHNRVIQRHDIDTEAAKLAGLIRRGQQ